MMLADVNGLIYAFRRDTEHHRVCRNWLDSSILGGARFGMSPLALAAVVRITTQTRAFATPSPLDEAFGYCDDILRQPNCQVVEPGERHWEIFRKLTTDTDTRGARITDAWFAALAIEWGCDWVTMDRDYARFPDLRWKLPDGK